MSDECKGYACPPSTTVDLPECEHGWELGNNTAVCATEPPQPVNLAATGGDLGMSLAFVGIALALVALGLNVSYLAHGRRRREAREQAEATKARDAETTKRLEAAGFVLIDGTWTRAPLR